MKVFKRIDSKVKEVVVKRLCKCTDHSSSNLPSKDKYWVVLVSLCKSSLRSIYCLNTQCYSGPNGEGWLKARIWSQTTWVPVLVSSPAGHMTLDNHWTSLNLTFLICKMETIMTPTSWVRCENKINECIVRFSHQLSLLVFFFFLITNSILNHNAIALLVSKNILNCYAL